MLISFTPLCKISLHSRTSTKMPHRWQSIPFVFWHALWIVYKINQYVKRNLLSFSSSVSALPKVLVWVSPAKSCASTMAASASFAATKREQSLLSFLDKIRFFLNHPMISTLIRCYFPKSSYMMFHLLSLTRAYICARFYLWWTWGKTEPNIAFFFCRFDFAK